jgi:protoporphyrinogen oxidase
MSLYVELGLPSDAAVDVDATLARVLDDLRAVGVVQDHRLLAWHAVVMDPAYVHVTQASQAEVLRLGRILQANGVYSIGRYGGWTYCSIEDNIVEARALMADLDAA